MLCFSSISPELSFSGRFTWEDLIAVKALMQSKERRLDFSVQSFKDTWVSVLVVQEIQAII